MIKTYYHFTPKENIFSILSSGIKPSIEGGVYLVASIDDGFKFLRFRPSGIYAFIPLQLDSKDIDESFDHNEEYIGCKAYITEKPITKDMIPGLQDIPLYVIERK